MSPGLLASTMAAAALAATGSPPVGGAQSPVTANFAPDIPAREWRSQARDYANTRYSTLDDVNLTNVADLRVAWTFSDGTQNGHEAAPLVFDDTMYLVTPYPNIPYALDLNKSRAPIKWSYKPDAVPPAIAASISR